VLRRWLRESIAGGTVAAYHDATTESAVADSDADSDAVDDTVLDAFREWSADEGPSLVTQLVDAYLADTPARVARLRVAVEAADVDGLREVAHSLRSSSAFVGARRLASMCESLETLGRVDVGSQAPATLDHIEAEVERVVRCLLIQRI
jgi:two-component system, sensor histidine kinase and response regulator